MLLAGGDAPGVCGWAGQYELGLTAGPEFGSVVGVGRERQVGAARKVTFDEVLVSSGFRAAETFPALRQSGAVTLCAFPAAAGVSPKNWVLASAETTFPALAGVSPKNWVLASVETKLPRVSGGKPEKLGARISRDKTSPR